MTMRVFKSALPAVAAVTLLGGAQAALAAVDSSYGGQGTDRFTLSAGGSLTRVTGDISVNGTIADGTLVDIDPDGTSKSNTSLLAGGNWRITNRNRVSLTWYRTGRENTITSKNDIVIGDTTIPAGASVTTDINTNYFFVNYRYSFIKNDNVELAGVLGLYGANISFDIAASAYPGNPNASFSNSESTGLPLPIIGGSFDWYISPRWTASLSLAGLSAKIGDIDGSTWVLTAGTHYMLFHNFGLGVSYVRTAIDVDVTKNNFNGSVDFDTSSFLLYGVVKF